MSAPTESAPLTSCPGCGQIEGVARTSSTPRVAAWKCRCAMAWAVSLVHHGQRPAYFDHLAATVEQLSATRSVLRHIIALASDSATFSNEELRDRLTALTEACARVSWHPRPAARPVPPPERPGGHHPRPRRTSTVPTTSPSTDDTGLPYLRDIDGTPIPFKCVVELVTVDEEHGAPRFRLHQQGQAIGRGTHLLYVRFRDDTVALRPDLVRVLTTDGG